uniref:Cytoplasmic tRNA 2-thiolation protein 2 n=1 Tax=Anabas testudineus TaxID=64144 RepID=A0A7N6A2K8_ANATE
MCQVEEDYRDELESVDVPSISKKCVKCKEASAAVVIRAGDAYCRVCFKEYFIHKFRAMLGKNRLIFPGEKVLLAVSGGPSSCSMLNQVKEGLSQNAHKKLRFRPGIIYIDEGGAVGQSVEERRRTVAELQGVFRATGFLFYVVPLEQVSEYALTVTDSTLCCLHRQHLLVHTARTEGYSKLMLGDNCTRLAVKLLTSISLGRGAQLAQDTGFSDSRYGDIISVRPMRDYSAKEIAYYNHLFNVPSVFIPSLDTKTADKASVQRLTESFVIKLQADFPSTVSTIYRTGEKLQTARLSSSTADHCDRCLLCMCALDTAVGECCCNL